VLKNLFLESLPEHERLTIIGAGEAVTQHSGDVIYRVGGGFPAIYFPLDAVISVTTELADGKIVESVTIGREGMAGLPFFLGATKSHHHVIAQVPGTSWRVMSPAFRTLMEKLPTFRARLGPFADSVMASMSQSSACIALHPVAQRCARWLLMTADRTGDNNFDLTQEFLAAMLGSHRPTVSLAAGMLQQKGLIRYHRGNVQITDRPGLEAVSCECYRVVTDIFETFLGTTITAKANLPDFLTARLD
jgi:CRP-like cAMP-binding protein